MWEGTPQHLLPPFLVCLVGFCCFPSLCVWLDLGGGAALQNKGTARLRCHSLFRVTSPGGALAPSLQPVAPIAALSVSQADGSKRATQGDFGTLLVLGGLDEVTEFIV